LSSLFVVLARQNKQSLSASELKWLAALEDHVRKNKPAV